MKFNFDIECTPEEARKFLGLPDVIPMQDALMKQLHAKLADNIRTLDPETLAKTWIPITMQNWSEMQKIFWNNLGVARGGGASTSRSAASTSSGKQEADSDSLRSSATRKPRRL